MICIDDSKCALLAWKYLCSAASKIIDFSSYSLICLLSVVSFIPELIILDSEVFVSLFLCVQQKYSLRNDSHQ